MYNYSITVMILGFLLHLLACSGVHAQTASGKSAVPSEEEYRNLRQACDVAASKQDVDTLIQLAHTDSVAISGTAIDKIKTLPIPQQKRAMAAVLRDDRFWNYDPVRGRAFRMYKEGQFDLQLRVRQMVSQLLKRELRQESKHYDPDEKKQVKAEGMNFEGFVIDPVSREKAAKDLVASQ